MNSPNVAPRLTVRAFAEMLVLPAYEQLRILNEQKNPQDQPQKFRIPYYLPALTAIRAFYRQENNPAAITEARERIETIRLKSKRDGNVRVLDGFESGTQYTRSLTPAPNVPIEVPIGGVQVKLQFDLVAAERGTDRCIFYNCRSASIDAETARTTLEIAHRVLEISGSALTIDSLEYVDISSNRTHRVKTRRATTLGRARQNAKVIETLWASL